MNKWLEILLGLILVLASAIGWVIPGGWGAEALAFLKGGIIWLVIMIGLLFLLLGISDLKE